jgi:hypothetical protein
MLHVVTFATDNSRLQYLKETAKLNNLEIHYIMKTAWNGFFDKILYTREFLSDLDDHDIVCFIDAYDVISLGSSDEIISKFKSYNCNLLLGSELNSFPEKYRAQYPKSESYTNYLYVNSGGYIGYKHAIMDLMTWKKDNEIISICSDGSDQAYFIEYYLNNMGHRVKLDIFQKIFQNMYFVSWNEFYIHMGRFVNVILNERPCFMHFNGHSSRTISWYDILPDIVNKLKASVGDTNIYTLHEFNQNSHATYFPHKQLNKA